MKQEWFKEYSQYLQRDMEFKVYGYGGVPMLVFPAQDGRFYDFENFQMVESVSRFIDEGHLQLFCCDSIDLETWSDKYGDCQHRTYMMEQWYHYIVDELVLRIHEINNQNQKGVGNRLFTAGCSMGATHALNFMLRRPDLFTGTIALSGYYDSDLFFGDYCDEHLYHNTPIRYLQGMDQHHPYVDLYRHQDIILCCGQGAWEEDMVRSASRMKELFAYKKIPAWVDFWGFDVAHDWNWWQIQFPYFVEKVI